MPRSTTATAPATEPKPRRTPQVTARERTPVRRKVAEASFDAAAHHDEIAHAAYLNWLARADGPGSPEEDWAKAVSAVRAKYAA